MLLNKKQGSSITMLVAPEDFMGLIKNLKPYILHQE